MAHSEKHRLTQHKVFWLEIGSMLFLVFSAYFWLKGSQIEPPVLKGVLSDIGLPMQELSGALKEQSELNRTAALCAGLGVGLQAAAAFFRTRG